jgi:hypothetical protein
MCVHVRDPRPIHARAACPDLAHAAEWTHAIDSVVSRPRASESASRHPSGACAAHCASNATRARFARST